MDVYRTSGLVCPTCPGSSLREFQDRYICDECQGILIGIEDFTSAVADLSGGEPTLEYFDEEPTTSACPRCTRGLRSCRLRIVTEGKRTKIEDRFLRCEHDGLWCGNGVLAGVFAIVGRRFGVAGGPIGAGSSFAEYELAHGLDGIPKRPGGAATDRLRISNWRNRPRRRAKTLTPINAYRDQKLTCPACSNSELAFQGDRWTCATCTGTFVENAALVAMVMEMTETLWELPAIGGTPGARACPVCGAPLIVEMLEAVRIDRCERHGVWFDPKELVAVLEHASGEFRPGVGAWLKRLFM